MYIIGVVIITIRTRKYHLESVFVGNRICNQPCMYTRTEEYEVEIKHRNLYYIIYLHGTTYYILYYTNEILILCTLFFIFVQYDINQSRRISDNPMSLSRAFVYYDNDARKLSFLRVAYYTALTRERPSPRTESVFRFRVERRSLGFMMMFYSIFLFPEITLPAEEWTVGVLGHGAF